MKRKEAIELWLKSCEESNEDKPRWSTFKKMIDEFESIDSNSISDNLEIINCNTLEDLKKVL